MKDKVRYICPIDKVDIDEIEDPFDINWCIIIFYKNGDFKLSNERPNEKEILKAYDELKA